MKKKVRKSRRSRSSDRDEDRHSSSGGKGRGGREKRRGDNRKDTRTIARKHESRWKRNRGKIRMTGLLSSSANEYDSEGDDRGRFENRARFADRNRGRARSRERRQRRENSHSRSKSRSKSRTYNSSQDQPWSGNADMATETGSVTHRNKNHHGRSDSEWASHRKQYSDGSESTWDDEAYTSAGSVSGGARERRRSKGQSSARSSSATSLASLSSSISSWTSMHPSRASARSSYSRLHKNTHASHRDEHEEERRKGLVGRQRSSRSSDGRNKASFRHNTSNRNCSISRMNGTASKSSTTCHQGAISSSINTRNGSSRSQRNESTGNRTTNASPLTVAGRDLGMRQGMVTKTVLHAASTMLAQRNRDKKKDKKRLTRIVGTGDSITRCSSTKAGTHTYTRVHSHSRARSRHFGHYPSSMAMVEAMAAEDPALLELLNHSAADERTSKTQIGADNRDGTDNSSAGGRRGGDGINKMQRTDSSRDLKKYLSRTDTFSLEQIVHHRDEKEDQSPPGNKRGFLTRTKLMRNFSLEPADIRATAPKKNTRVLDRNAPLYLIDSVTEKEERFYTPETYYLRARKRQSEMSSEEIDAMMTKMTGFNPYSRNYRHPHSSNTAKTQENALGEERAGNDSESAGYKARHPLSADLRKRYKYIDFGDLASAYDGERGMLSGHGVSGCVGYSTDDAAVKLVQKRKEASKQLYANVAHAMLMSEQSSLHQRNTTIKNPTSTNSATDGSGGDTDAEKRYYSRAQVSQSSSARMSRMSRALPSSTTGASTSPSRAASRNARRPLSLLERRIQSLTHAPAALSTASLLSSSSSTQRAASSSVAASRKGRPRHHRGTRRDKPLFSSIYSPGTRKRVMEAEQSVVGSVLKHAVRSGALSRTRTPSEGSGSARTRTHTFHMARNRSAPTFVLKNLQLRQNDDDGRCAAPPLFNIEGLME